MLLLVGTAIGAPVGQYFTQDGMPMLSSAFAHGRGGGAATRADYNRLGAIAR